ncbi:MAG: hypothetical protein ABJA50_02700 [Chloroflexota bacterium]
MSTGSNATAVANQPAGTNPEVQKEISLGMGTAQSGDKASAYRIFQSLATRYTDAPDVWVWLGGTSPNLDEAEAAFQRAVMLDPMNEEANLGLRWVTLRKHAIAEASSPSTSSSTSTTSSLDTGVFTMGRTPSERLSDSLHSRTGGLGQAASSATGPLGTGRLNNSLKTAIIDGGPSSSPLLSSDTDKSVKMKVNGKSRLSRVPIGAVILILIAIALYAFAAWMLLR